MVERDRESSSTPSASTVRIEIPLRTILMVLGGILGTWLFLKLLPVWLVVLGALMLAGTLGPSVAWLESRGVARTVAVLLVFGVAFGIFLVLVTLSAPVLVAQIKEFVQSEPTLRMRLADYMAQSRWTSSLGNWLRELKYGELLKTYAQEMLLYSTRLALMVAYAASAVFLAVYLIIDQDRVRTVLYSLVPRKHHLSLSRIIPRSEALIGNYIRGQAITSMLTGLFVFALLKSFGVDNALAIAVLAGLADVLPYIGIVLSVGPVLLATLPLGPVACLASVALMFVYEEVESRILIPRIYGKTMRLPSSVILFSILAGSTLFGIVGAILAIPVSAALQMLIEELRMKLPGESVAPLDQETHLRDRITEEEYRRRTDGIPVEDAAVIAAKLSKEGAPE